MLYAEDPALRRRQILRDLAVAIAIVVIVAVAVNLFRSIRELRGPGVVLEQAGASISSAASLASGLGDLPFVGDTIVLPFDALVDAGTTLAEAGRAQITAVDDLARWTSLAVGGLPIAALLGAWVPRRVRWSRDARGGRALLDAGADDLVFAHRALTMIPLDRLADTVQDPARALSDGRSSQLATLEIQRLGLVVR